MSQIFKDDVWKEMLDPLLGKTVGFVSIPGNAGDNLHKEGAKQLMDRAGITWYGEDFSNPDTVTWPDVLVYPGGGVLGKFYDTPIPSKHSDYKLQVNLRPSYIMRSRCENSSTPFVIFPQSFVAKDIIKNCSHLWVREKYSLNFSPMAKFAHDTSLAYRLPEEHVSKIQEPTIEYAIALKNDNENIIQIPLESKDPTDNISVDDHVGYLSLASKHKCIVTDRCHFAIAALIANQYSKFQREIILVPNSYHKNLGIWEASLKEFGVKFWNLSEILENIKNGRFK